jgi:putative membrane protein
VLPALASARVHGVEDIPREGPVLIVARHYHHLLDGAVLLARVPRPVHIVVALDWARSAAQRRWMERLCALAQWPVILRPAAVSASGAYTTAETAGYLRAGVRAAVAQLRAGHVVVVFPEGFPHVDPAPIAGRAPRGAELLPFARGFRLIADLARRAGAPAPIVPLGFRYARAGGRWSIEARFGAPLPADADVATVERAVAALSGVDTSLV